MTWNCIVKIYTIHSQEKQLDKKNKKTALFLHNFSIMKTLSKVRLSRDFFQNSILVWNDKFRIDNFNRKVKIAKRDCDFSMPKKQAREQQLRLDSFRRKTIYWNNYFFKWKTQEKNFLENNISLARKKDFENVLSKMAFEKRQEKRKKKAFSKIFW